MSALKVSIKFSMAQRVFGVKFYGLSDAEQQQQVLYGWWIAPNDESMFARFPLSVGVANICWAFVDVMRHRPRYQALLSLGGWAWQSWRILCCRRAAFK